MARHAQQPEKHSMTCSACKLGTCETCVDVSLLLIGRPAVCTCGRQNHSQLLNETVYVRALSYMTPGGEPVDRQVEDPTRPGFIVAPGLTVDEDGKVTYNS